MNDRALAIAARLHRADNRLRWRVLVVSVAMLACAWWAAAAAGSVEPLQPPGGTSIRTLMSVDATPVATPAVPSDTPPVSPGGVSAGIGSSNREDDGSEVEADEEHERETIHRDVRDDDERDSDDETDEDEPRRPVDRPKEPEVGKKLEDGGDRPSDTPKGD